MNFRKLFASFFKFHKMPALLLTLFSVSCMSADQDTTSAKIPVRVLIVNFFEIGNDIEGEAGERQLWVKRLHLNKKIDFPEGLAPLYYNADTQVLNMLTKQANINSALSMMALGLDPRFDLSKAYILMTGIAGGDPEVISLGSAVWSRYIVDGDLKHSIDPREMPKGWQNGTFSYMEKEPQKAASKFLGTELFEISPSLLKWAYNLTKDITIPDDVQIQKRRALYKDYKEAMLPPRVAIGDNMAASEYWHGKLKTQWAREWVRYQTKGKGTFYTTAMEDTGVLSAIKRLSKNGLVDKNRVLSLRTVSNYSMQWAGGTAYESFMGDKDGYSGLKASLESAYIVGNKVIQTILKNWDQYKNQTP